MSRSIPRALLDEPDQSIQGPQIGFPRHGELFEAIPRRHAANPYRLRWSSPPTHGPNIVAKAAAAVSPCVPHPKSTRKPGLLESGPVRWRLGTWLLVSLCTIGCATTGTLKNGVYHGSETSYRIGPVGQGWTRVTVDHQNDLAWHSTAKGAVMHVDSTCDPAFDIPLIALRTHLLIGFTDREIVSEETLPMDGREALRTHARAKLDGVPRDILLQILKKDGCVYDFGLITPPGPSFEEALEDFDDMLAGFTTTGKT